MEHNQCTPNTNSFKNVLRTFEAQILKKTKNIQPHIYNYIIRCSYKKESIVVIDLPQVWRNLFAVYIHCVHSYFFPESLSLEKALSFLLLLSVLRKHKISAHVLLVTTLLKKTRCGLKQILCFKIWKIHHYKIYTK